MDNQTTRRGLLAAAGLASVAAAVPAIAGTATSNQPASIRPEFRAKLDAIGKARAHAQAYTANVTHPAADRLRTMQAAIPHVTIQTPTYPGDSRAYLEWSTKNRMDVACARGIARLDGKLRQQPGQLAQDAVSIERRKNARRFYAAYLRRKRALARATEASGWPEASVQDDRNAEAWADAETAFYTMPVASMAELVLKMDTLEDLDGFSDNSVPVALLADVRFLAAREG